MQVPENAEYKDLQIQGLNFRVPIFITPKAFVKKEIATVCSPEMAASIMQQVMMENIRNNFAKTVTKAVMEEAKALGSDAKKVSDLDDETSEKIFEKFSSSGKLAELQAELDTYIAEYEPGVRRTGGGESLSPVDREARNIAKTIVLDHLEKNLGIGRTARSQSHKEWDEKLQSEGSSAQEQIDALIEQVLEKKPDIYDTARQNVESRKAATQGITLDFGTK